MRIQIPRRIAVKRKLQRQENLRAYLTDPISDFPWLREYTDEENKRGLQALRELKTRLDTVTVRMRPAAMANQKYILHLYSAKKALDKGQYSLACHELLDVLYFYCQYQQVLCVVSDMIKPYCGVV